MRRSSTDRDPGRLGRLETLGAWLGLWTPPRGTVVPPVPWRAIAVGAALLVVVLGAAAAVGLPELAENRQAAREREQRTEAERHAAFLAMVEREQRPRRARGRPDPGRGAAAARRTAARAALLAGAEAGIERDAHRRTGRDIRGVECERFPRTLGGTEPVRDLARRAAAYDCVAVTARFGDGESAGGRGIIGISFRLVVRFHEGRSAWCRIIPLGDRDRLSRPLPSACRERRGS